MVAEASALEQAVQMGKVPVAKPTFGYYRQSNGWITVSPATDLEELKYRREMWEPLTQYGRIEMASEYMADHPLEALFMQGGAKELPVDQIIEQGLHLNPPIIPSCGRLLNQFHKRHNAVCWRNPVTVTFPQLEGVVPEGFQCRFCGRSPFPTEQARDQHEGVMHKDEKSDIRTGKSLADSLVEGLTSGGAIALRPGREEVPPTTKPYLCGFCNEGFDRPTEFLKHVKKHKEQANGKEVAEG